jgi:hypothetical protein
MPASRKPARELIERNSDISEFGEKDQHGAYSEPLNIAGEKVDIEQLPALHSVDEPKGKSKAPVRR